MILTEEHQMIRDALRSFSQERLAPNAARWDKEHHFPKEELQELAALGAFGVAVPEHLGGAGLDYVSLALVLEEIAAGDGGTSTIISVNNCPVCSIAMMYANDAQKEQWLRPLAQGEMLGAFPLTEPNAGSDAAAIRTSGEALLSPSMTRQLIEEFVRRPPPGEGRPGARDAATFPASPGCRDASR